MAEYRIDEPCSEAWEAMTPGEQGRHCARCDRQVLDLSAMPAAEARRVLDRAACSSAARPGEAIGICARVAVPVAPASRRRRRRVLFSGIASLLAFGSLGAAEDATPLRLDVDPQPVEIEPQVDVETPEVTQLEVEVEDIEAEAAQCEPPMPMVLGRIILDRPIVVPVEPDPADRPENIL